MPKQHKPIQRRKDTGVFFVRLRRNGQRFTRSLETKDPAVAARRAAQALAELEQLAHPSAPQKWRHDTPGTEWTIPDKPDGTPDWDNAIPKAVVASEVLEPEQLKDTEWRDLVNEAVAVRKRKRAENYSDAWYQNVQSSLQSVPFQFKQATPALIRDWVHAMQKEGLGGRSIEMRCGVLASLSQICIRSGMLEGYVSPWPLVDYASDPSQVKHIYTAVESDYRGLKDLLPTLVKEQRIPILLQAYLGTRISELKRRQPEDFDLEACVMKINHVPGTKQTTKNRHSIRETPLPQWLCEELKDWSWKWPVTETVNKRTKSVNPKLTTHSFRHGLIRINRDQGGEPMVIEAFTGHKIGRTHRSDMAATYGDGFSLESKRIAIEPIWQQLNAWIFDE